MIGIVLAQMMNGNESGGSGGMGNGDWWWIWVVAGLVVLALLVVLVIEVTRHGTRGFDSPPVHPGAAGSAEQVLADRFARGEIDAEEYQHRRAVLRG